MFPLFGLRTGITKKKISRYSGRERELPKSFPAIRDRNGKPKKTLPAVWEWEFEAFMLGNIREREFPLMPANPSNNTMALLAAKMPAF